MSRKDNCLDNTMAESFFGIMKSELLYAENFESTEAFIKALDNYIEYYNNKSQVKWKESGAIPNSFSCKLIFICLIFGVHFKLGAASVIIIQVLYDII